MQTICSVDEDVTDTVLKLILFWWCVIILMSAALSTDAGRSFVYVCLRVNH